MKRISSMDALTVSGNSGKLAGTFNRAFGHMSRRVRSRAAATAKSWSLFAVNNIHRAAPKKLVSSTVSITRQLSKTSLQMLSAVANMTAISQQGSNDDNLSFDLDWQPSLSLAQEMICWSCAAVAACLMYIFTAPAGFSIVYASCIGLVFGLVLNTLRSALLEEMYKAREKIEADLGDADSRFRQINNLQVHVKVATASSLPPPAPTAAAARLAPPPTASAAGRSGPVPSLHCYHGFGSNTWSWSLVQKPLADRLRALVTSHDMPGFGLTQRPTDLSGYYLAFNGRLGRLAMDYELAVRGLLSRAEAARSGETNYPHATVHPAAVAAGSLQSNPQLAAQAERQAVQSLEAAAGGPPQEAAEAAVDQGLESKAQAAAAAAAEGSIGGAVKAAVEATRGPASSSDAAAGDGPAVAEAPAAIASKQQQQQQQQQQAAAVKRVLVGHSLGSACAALEFIANPSDYAALVLVAPAIISKLSFKGGADEDEETSDSSNARRGQAAIKLEMLQDGTLFTQSLATGEFAEQSAAAIVAAAAGATTAEQDDPSSADRARRASSSSSSSSTQLDDLAAAQGNMTRASNRTSLFSSNSSAGSDSDADTAAGGSKTASAAAAQDVVVYATKGDDSSFQELLNQPKDKSLLGGLLRKMVGLAQTCSMLTTVLILSALRPAIVMVLRTVVRSRKFWANSLKQAYYDQSKVTPAAVDAYRMPQLVRGWETGMVQFLLARLGAGGSRGATTAAAALAPGSQPPGGLEDVGLAMRFAAAVAAADLPVLIVHGAGDKLVPVSNSFNLARLIKNCRLAVVKKAGHCPQEEQPELFTDLVCGFLRKHVKA